MPRATRKRVRRTPEEARIHLLDAADRVFARHLPDTVGLKAIANEAGVSHALISHYFGTYEGLVNAALERRFEQLRGQVVPAMLSLIGEGAGAPAMLAAHRKVLVSAAQDPATMRLAIWALLSDRMQANDFFPQRVQGLRMLTDALMIREKAPREDVEFALVASLAMAVVWTVGKRALAGGLGKKPSKELDTAVEERIARMIAGFLT